MIFPFLRRTLSPILGTFTSQFSKGWTSRYGTSSAKRTTNPQPGSIRLDDVSNGSHSGIFRKKGGGGAPFSQYPLTNLTAEGGSDEYLGEGIRKEMEVRIEEERMSRTGHRAEEEELDRRASQNLARALYGQPGVTRTEVEHRGGGGGGEPNRNRVSILNGKKDSFGDERV